jgi:hypothetical protein
MPEYQLQTSAPLLLDAPLANRILLALERLDQQSGLDPALADLRELIRAALIRKSSGNSSGVPSSGE